jgi:hypothetical protein
MRLTTNHAVRRDLDAGLAEHVLRRADGREDVRHSTRRDVVHQGVAPERSRSEGFHPGAM